MKIAIIGAGNIGGAIARGLKTDQEGVLFKSEIMVSDLAEDKTIALRQQCPHIKTTKNNQEAANKADVVIFAVKPWLMEPVVKAVKLEENQILLSVAAGVKFQTLANFVEHKNMTMFRVIPNIAVSIGQSMSLVASRNATQAQEQLVLDIFNQLGLALMLEEEKLSAVTALTSCGIAYVLKYIQAAMQAGIELGFPAQISKEMVAQTVIGAGKLLLADTNSHPSTEIDKVCTPGGLTIKGINELEHTGFSSAIIKAIKASCV